MANKINKPKLNGRDLVNKMKEEKGIVFEITSEEAAEYYLINVNNYMRTAAYRKNYQKHSKGMNRGKYINLDFAYLQELSTIDMHLRFLISKMCLDIEHDLKVKMLKDIENDESTDGYDIVKNFLDNNKSIVGKLETISTSPFTSDLINKYFSIDSAYDQSKGKSVNKISTYDDCPAWVLLEILTFGDFIKFYKFYYKDRDFNSLSNSILNLVRGLRNAAAHNNCILADLSHGTSNSPNEISLKISQISSINSNQRQKKLSCRPMLEFVTMLYVYKSVVSEKVKYHRVEELQELFFNRMVRNKEYFKNNELIKSNYDFICKVIKAFFDIDANKIQ